MLLNCSAGEDPESPLGSKEINLQKYFIWFLYHIVHGVLKPVILYSLEGLMLKLKLQYFGHQMCRPALRARGCVSGSGDEPVREFGLVTPSCVFIFQLERTVQGAEGEAKGGWRERFWTMQREPPQEVQGEWRVCASFNSQAAMKSFLQWKESRSRPLKMPLRDKYCQTDHHHHGCCEPGIPLSSPVTSVSIRATLLSVFFSSSPRSHS